MIDDYKHIQPTAYQILKNSIVNNQISHAYLFDISSCTYGMNMAISFIKSILCPYHYTNCSNCINCMQCKNISNNEYPDIEIIYPENMCIKKDKIIKLQENFNTTSFIRGKKVYIIAGAEYMNESSSNTLLKFLEEPQNNIIAILLTKNINNILETIKSRCQIISLIPSKENDSYLRKIGSIIYSNNNDIDLFANDNTNEDKINKIIDFIVFYEKNGLDTLLYTQKLWFKNNKTKSDNVLVLNILVLFYKDIINYKIGRNIDIFDNMEEIIKMISNKNSVEKLYNKLKILLNSLDKNKININLGLNIDNMIIEMENI